MSSISDTNPGKRSAGTRPTRRIPARWPADRDFRILSIDGGGIRGVFPAAVLAGLEDRYLGGASIADRFDLIAGTSTGGILALGFGAGLTARQLLDLYIERGPEIFPPPGRGWYGAIEGRLNAARRYALYSYDRKALKQVLTDALGERRLDSSASRLCIPAFEGAHSEIFVFKTPHHEDFKLDYKELMVTVGLATSAAPTYFRPLSHGGYTLVDGGVWANNPIMIALVEGLTSFDVPRERVRILSIGCGDSPYTVSGAKLSLGGLLFWRDVMFAAMRLQSQAALGQARLLLGPERVIRVDPPEGLGIALDDWRRSSVELPPIAGGLVASAGPSIAEQFLQTPVAAYEPHYRFAAGS